MDNQDRAAIDDLFARLAEAGRRGPGRDGEAEALIREHVRRRPETAYYLAQTAIMQEHALRAAEERLREAEEELSAQAQPQRGGFLSGLFGGGGGRSAGFGAPARADGPWSAAPQAGGGYGGGLFGGGMSGGAGGGFLAGAAQTAMGVTGGILLGHALSDMFDGGGGAAHAAEPAGFLGDGGDHGAGDAGSEGLFGDGPDLSGGDDW